MFIKYWVDIGFCGCDEADVIEFPDDTSEATINREIEELANEYASSWEGDAMLGDWDEESTEFFYENIDWGWEEVEHINDI